MLSGGLHAVLHAYDTQLAVTCATQMQVASLGVPYVLMHMRGDPTTMQQRRHTHYTNVAADVGQELQAAADRAMAAGIEPWSLILDPGVHSRPCKLHVAAACNSPQ